MGGFVFRLQKVLEYREQLEDKKKQAFVKARLDYLKEMDILKDLENKLDLALTDIEEKSTGVFTYIAKHNYITLLEERIKDQAKKAKVYEDEMNKKNEEFKESQKSRKVIYKLKENALKDYNAAQDKQEQNLNDEFALYGYVRK